MQGGSPGTVGMKVGRVRWLPVGVNRVILRLFVLTEYQRVTDRQTDSRTDRQTRRQSLDMSKLNSAVSGVKLPVEHVHS